ncbi:MAG: hypothetical protein NVSMB27_23340 [Ktedonobacteraceae bacterium]
MVVELFEGGWLELGEDLSPVRVIVARHPAPPKGEEHSGGQARRVSAVRRLLPPPAPVPVERKPVLLGPIRWVDGAGRALRRTWMTHWHRLYVEILPLADMPPSLSPPPRPPRAVRSHHRWSWHDRLACNAWSGPPHQRITEAFVPTCLASN